MRTTRPGPLAMEGPRGVRLIAVLIVLAALLVGDAGPVLGQEEGDDEFMRYSGETIVIKPIGEKRLIDKDGLGFVSLVSDYTMDVYVERTGSNRTTGDHRSLQCGNATECCFQARDVMIFLVNMHKDISVVATYKSVSTCSGASKAIYVTALFVAVVSILFCFFGVALCFWRAQRPFSAESFREMWNENFRRIPILSGGVAEDERASSDDHRVVSHRLRLDDD